MSVILSKELQDKAQKRFNAAIASLMSNFFKSAIRGSLDVTVQAPTKVTVKDRAGRYSTAPLIGGERFEPKSAYTGKKGQVIVVFAPTRPEKYAFIEVPIDEADALFGKTLLLSIEEWMNHKDDEHSRSIMEQLTDMERRDINEVIAKKSADTSPDFATW